MVKWQRFTKEFKLEAVRPWKSRERVHQPLDYVTPARYEERAGVA